MSTGPARQLPGTVSRCSPQVGDPRKRFQAKFGTPNASAGSSARQPKPLRSPRDWERAASAFLAWKDRTQASSLQLCQRAGLAKMTEHRETSQPKKARTKKTGNEERVKQREPHTQGGRRCGATKLAQQKWRASPDVPCHSWRQIFAAYLCSVVTAPPPPLKRS